MTEINFSLPHEYILRKAKPFDIWLILFFMVKARLDATQLKLQQFWIIEYDGRLVAFGQLRNFSFAQELGSLYVVPEYRNQGLGTFLAEYLSTQATQPLYLKCVKKELISFYIKRCFVNVNYEDLPPSLKSKFFLSQVRKRLLKGFVIFMKYES